LDRSVHPPRVSHLHYVFDGWLSDEVLEGFPCWIVTESLARRIREAGLTGVDFGDVEVSAGDTFLELYPGRTLPAFVRLLPTGIARTDDFGVGSDHRLVALEKALAIIRSTNPSDLLVTPSE
jgi:hypothetical protein